MQAVDGVRIIKFDAINFLLGTILIEFLTFLSNQKARKSHWNIHYNDRSKSATWWALMKNIKGVAWIHSGFPIQQVIIIDKGLLLALELV